MRLCEQLDIWSKQKFQRGKTHILVITRVSVTLMVLWDREQEDLASVSSTYIVTANNKTSHTRVDPYPNVGISLSRIPLLNCATLDVIYTCRSYTRDRKWFISCDYHSHNNTTSEKTKLEKNVGFQTCNEYAWMRWYTLLYAKWDKCRECVEMATQ